MAPEIQTQLTDAEIENPSAAAAEAVDVREGWEETTAGDEQVIVWERTGANPDLRDNHGELRTTGWEVAIKCAEYGPDFAVMARPMCDALAFRSQVLLKTSNVEAAAREVSRFMRTVNATPNGWSLIETDGGERHRWMSWDGEQTVKVWQEARNCGEPRTFTTTATTADQSNFDGAERLVKRTELMDAVQTAAGRLEEVDGYPEPKWEPTIEA
ncbi:hypothetical protein [Halorubrum sp. Atlit-26R]|jgi:hypothetical protein|uniref:hypothetical protein n=1 Tax=Halorubrum sp. Atlit-26R TaxID=2282128 RepID=UPI000EF2160E|nr:hypothetical protein [Halorubrum sp. Atlit-26R]RLM68494.1 hypothetical protein DVK07_10245 [Halorubrum sp. Atlit-26R]